MATNNIKIFDQNKANMLTDEAYNTSTQRLNGVQQGIASSQLQNKTLYQVSLVAYAIGQMMQANGLNANDADAVSTFAGNLSNTIVQKILDKADTTEAKNFTVNNKFITPQTWKAAYDFMKADSDMVTSAVDDTHYITPKLLKEGANLFGGKVELEDGSIAKWNTLNKVIINKVTSNYYSKYSKSIKQFITSYDKKYCLVAGEYTSSSGSANGAILLYDAETNDLLDSKTEFTYNENNYIISSNYAVSILSKKNYALVRLNNKANNKVAIAAVDFSTNKLTVKNIIESDETIFYGSVEDHTTFFDDTMYAWFYGIYSVHPVVARYDINSNLFSKITVTTIDVASNNWVMFNERNNAFLIFFEYQGNNYNVLYVAKIIENNVTTNSIMDLSNDNRNINFSMREDYIYAFGYSHDRNYIMNKISITTLVASILPGFSSPGPNGSKFIINDEENAIAIDGNAYGPGASAMNVEPVTVYLDFGQSVNILQATKAVITTKYNNEYYCADINFLLQPIYAYFGAPTTEI